MQTLVQIAISIVVATAFDWGLHFQTQLFGGIATDSRRPRPYHPPDPIRIVMMILYLVPINVMVYYKMKEFNFWWVVLLITLPAYTLYSYGEALKPTNEVDDGR